MLSSDSPTLPFSMRDSAHALPGMCPSKDITLSEIGGLVLLPKLSGLVSSALSTRGSKEIVTTSYSLT